MPNATKVTVVWTGLGGSPYLSTLWLNSTLHPSMANVQTVASGFIALLCEAVDNALTATIQQEVSIWSTPDTLVSTDVITGGPIQGVKSANAAPRATQGLLRLRTNGFNGNRRNLGHIYVPGVTVDSLTVADGKPSAAYQTLLNNAAAVADAGSFMVPGRKSNQFYETTTVTADSEFAVLRSRRD